MAKIFAKLNLGDIVATSGSRSFKKLISQIAREFAITQLSTTLPGSGICAAALTIGAKIWVFGTSSVLTFDPETYTLTTTDTTLSPGYSSRSLTAIGTKVYLFGGHQTGSYAQSVSVIHVFDTETNTIQTLTARLPTAAEGIASVAVGTKIYLFGGRHYPEQTYTDSYYSLSTINVFDTETNTITTLNTALPEATYWIAATAVGTKIYLFGGVVNINTINVFDTETNTIQTLSVTLPTGAWNIGSAAIGTKIYLFGGAVDNTGNSINTINVFDTETNTIKTLDETLPTAANGLAEAVVGSNVYLFGGSTGGSNGGINTIIEVQT